MVMRVINNGKESFRETKHIVKIREQHRSVWSRRHAGEHVEFIVFFLMTELKENAPKRFLVVTEDMFTKVKKEKQAA